MEPPQAFRDPPGLPACQGAAARADPQKQGVWTAFPKGRQVLVGQGLRLGHRVPSARPTTTATTRPRRFASGPSRRPRRWRRWSGCHRPVRWCGLPTRPSNGRGKPVAAPRLVPGGSVPEAVGSRRCAAAVSGPPILTDSPAVAPGLRTDCILSNGAGASGAGPARPRPVTTRAEPRGGGPRRAPRREDRPARGPAMPPRNASAAGRHRGSAPGTARSPARHRTRARVGGTTNTHRPVLLAAPWSPPSSPVLNLYRGLAAGRNGDRPRRTPRSIPPGTRGRTVRPCRQPRRSGTTSGKRGLPQPPGRSMTSDEIGVRSSHTPPTIASRPGGLPPARSRAGRRGALCQPAALSDETELFG